MGAEGPRLIIEHGGQVAPPSGLGQRIPHGGCGEKSLHFLEEVLAGRGIGLEAADAFPQSIGKLGALALVVGEWSEVAAAVPDRPSAA